MQSQCRRRRQLREEAEAAETDGRTDGRARKKKKKPLSSEESRRDNGLGNFVAPMKTKLCESLSYLSGRETQCARS